MKTTTLLIGLTLLVTGCDSGPPPIRGNGQPASESRPVESFEAVSIAGQGRIEITIGPAAGVEVEGDQNILPMIETRVQDGTLRIRRTRRVSPRLPLIVRVTAPNLNSIGTAGVANCDAGPFDNEKLTLSLAGTGTVTLRGRTGHLVANLAGASRLQAGDLFARDVALNLAGAGKADVVAAETLDVELAGLGQVNYSGSPAITKRIVGLGRLKQVSPLAEPPDADAADENDESTPAAESGTP